MYIAITGDKNNSDVYIKQSYRKENGRTSSRIYKKLGKFNDLLAQFNGDEDQMLAWAKNEAKKETALYNQKNGKVSMDFSQGSRIALNEQRLFNSGYLFLQCLVTQLRMDKICRSIASRHKFQYDLHAIFTDLIYARILHPSSKRETYEYCRSLVFGRITKSLPKLPCEQSYTLYPSAHRHGILLHKLGIDQPVTATLLQPFPCFLIHLRRTEVLAVFLSRFQIFFDGRYIRTLKRRRLCL